MSKMRLRAAALIIAAVIIGGFALSVPHARDATPHSTMGAETAAVPRVTLHDSFRKGTHTITGSLEVPNACMSVAVQASLQGDASSTESIIVAISLPEEAGVCLQVPTEADFSVQIQAHADVPLSATVNGALASTTVL